MTFLGSEGNFGRHVYFAFGSNLNRSQMFDRCPDAIPICTFRLQGWKLVFRGTADIVPVHRGYVSGGLYSVSERDLHLLDRFEGVSRGCYQRIEVRSDVSDCIIAYRMGSEDIFPPEDDYFTVIRQGYEDWNLSPVPLLAARRAAFEYATVSSSRRADD